MGDPADSLIDLLLRTGVILSADSEPARSLIARIRAIPDSGLTEHELIGIAQAFGRGVERIALAGSDIAARHLADSEGEELERRLMCWLDDLRPLADEAFSVYFGRRLEHLARRRLADPIVNTPVPIADVAIVDLRGSTEFMLANGPRDVARLADAIYATGQEIAHRHQIAAGKFLGDGVLFVSAHADKLLAAATEAVATLETATPLPAAAGVARGEIVRRGGDWFGTPVNVAARLAELASAGELLLDTSLGFEAGTPATVTLRGLAEPRQVSVLRA